MQAPMQADMKANVEADMHAEVKAKKRTPPRPNYSNQRMDATIQQRPKRRHR